MISISDVNKYLSGESSTLDSQPKDDSGTPPSDSPAPGSTEDPIGDPAPEAQEAVETGSPSPDRQEPPAEDPAKLPKSDPAPTETLPYKASAAPNSKEWKANRAFIKQKEKFKRKLAENEAKIADLQAKLSKYEAVDLEGLDQAKRMDVELEKKLLKRDIGSIAEDSQALSNDWEASQADEIHEARIARCMSTEAEASHYRTLLENGRDKFVEFLAKMDPESAILQYLDDSDVSPLLVRTLMTQPKILKAIVSKRNPMSKAIEMRNLESRLMMARKLRQTSPRSPKPLAVTGKVVGAPGPKAAPQSMKTIADVNRYLKDHP